MRFTRDCPQDGDALSRDAKTAVAEDVGRIDLHDPDSRQKARTTRSIESVQLSASDRLVHVKRASGASLDRSTSIDIFTDVDTKGAGMRKLFERTREPAVSCERCGRVCDAGCRGAALRERALLRQLRLGVRA